MDFDKKSAEYRTPSPADEPRVIKALEEINSKKKGGYAGSLTRGDKIGILSFMAIILVAGVLKITIAEYEQLNTWFQTRHVPINRLLNSLISIMLVLVVERLISSLLIQKIGDLTTRYNLSRLFRLIIILVAAFIVISTVFINWYTAAISLGVISLILGLALQNPLTSFFAWIYILIKKPYEVGDRITIGSSSGDVIELGYFDTTLWEFGGKYISGDHPSGRIIRFPNSKVFDEFVFNYSWPLFPYLWNEIKFYVAYDSDLAFVEEVVAKIIEEEVGAEMMKRVEEYHVLLNETPVEALKVREKPAVFFRTSENTWVEVVARYLVEPKESGRVKSRLIKNILHELNQSQEKVKFPLGNNR